MDAFNVVETMEMEKKKQERASSTCKRGTKDVGEFVPKSIELYVYGNNENENVDVNVESELLR